MDFQCEIKEEKLCIAWEGGRKVKKRDGNNQGKAKIRICRKKS